MAELSEESSQSVMDWSLSLDNFIWQQGDNGAKLLSQLNRYITYYLNTHSSVQPQDQQDVLQEVAIKLLKNPNYPYENCQAWLLTLVRNTCIDYLRKQQSQKRLLAPDEDGLLVAMSLDQQQSLRLTDQEIYQDIECLQHVFEHIATQVSGVNDLEIYSLYAQGWSNGEIAEKTQRTTGAIAKKLSELRKRVQQLRQALC